MKRVQGALMEIGRLDFDMVVKAMVSLDLDEVKRSGMNLELYSYSVIMEEPGKIVIVQESATS
jgi:hypothetical protein